MKLNLRYTIPSLLFILLFTSYYGEAQYPWPPKGEEGVDYFVNDRATPKPDGLHYRTYAKGEIYYAGQFENGKPKAGTDFYYYHESKPGAVMSIHSFTDDIRVVNAAVYHDNGKPEANGQYINQKKEGVWNFYDLAGVLKNASTYENDMLNGISTTYHFNGAVYKTETYVDDVPHGPWAEFYDDDTKKAEGSNKDGVIDGAIKHYYPSGTPMIQGQYVNGLMDGLWIKFLSSGKIQLTTKYKDGAKIAERRENGDFEDYWESGVPKAFYEYENGMKNGPFEEWYDMGSWERKPKPDSDGSQGMEFIDTLVGTQLSRKGDFMDDKLEGEIIYYDQDGRIIKVEHYVDGELESTE